ncbi:hypothetical protein SprV_0301226400 [Sparganum proliferum]
MLQACSRLQYVAPKQPISQRGPSFAGTFFRTADTRELEPGAFMLMGRNLFSKICMWMVSGRRSQGAQSELTCAGQGNYVAYGPTPSNTT